MRGEEKAASGLRDGGGDAQRKQEGGGTEQAMPMPSSTEKGI